MSKEADKAVSSYKKLIDFGKIYEVDTEEDYKAAALTYSQEVQLIAQMRQRLAEDGQTITKTYVKDRENLCVHPLIQEIPKHVDCANRTLAILGDIIVKRGKKKADVADGLAKFRERA
jgi:hypothetical protein